MQFQVHAVNAFIYIQALMNSVILLMVLHWLNSLEITLNTMWRREAISTDSYFIFSPPDVGLLVDIRHLHLN